MTDAPAPVNLPAVVPADRLGAVCSAEDLDAVVPGLRSTAELEPLQVVPGQERALDALRFALEMDHPGYNAFVIGQEGAGKRELVRDLVERKAACRPEGKDVVYVMDFKDSRRPRALLLPAGRGRVLRERMARSIDDLVVALRAAFESDEYQVRRRALEHMLSEQQDLLINEVRDQAKGLGVVLVRTPTGVALAPMDAEGEMVPADDFGSLSPEDRERFEAGMSRVNELMEESMSQLPRLERMVREQIRQLDQEVTAAVAQHFVAELRSSFDLPGVREWLDEVEADIIEHAAQLLGPGDGELALELLSGMMPTKDPVARYAVNSFVDRTGERGAPVVVLDDPKLPDLAGRIEHVATFGALSTDHTLVRAGALHRANGGYLVLDARRLATRPFSWDALKAALRTRELRVEPPSTSLGVMDTIGLEPEPLALDVKVVLIGDAELFWLMSAVDPELERLFKVMVDFEDRMPADAGGRGAYARMVASVVAREGLRHLDRDALAAVICQASRAVEDRERLDTNPEALANLLREASHEAGRAGAELVGRAHVVAAIHAARRRTGRMADRTRESMVREVVRLPTHGRGVGEITGLSVLQMGRVRFGRPGRISARVRLGQGGVVDIEREVKLGGPLHSKGVPILSGFLGARFGARSPLAFAATIVFEQSYGPLDGDSASLAETLALLSALSELPVRHDIAVTGSMDQLGRVQAVGGVADKIEGFFELCEARGLTGTQGVVVPASNIDHIVLRSDVAEAVAAGRFTVWAAETVDQAAALVMGTDAGVWDAEAEAWTEGSINGRVAARLAGFVAAAKALKGGGDEA